MERHTTIIDLRGSAHSSAGPGFDVLADPTGRRGRRLRRAGHVVAGLFALWLAALALAGLGLLPGAGVPLAPHTGARIEPPPLDARSPLAPAKGSKPALAARSATPINSARRVTPTPPGRAPARRREGGQRRDSARQPNITPVRPRTTRNTRPATRPAATPAPSARAVVSPGRHRGATAPSHRAALPGQSGTAPGKTRAPETPVPAPTAAPGKSGAAPRPTR